MTVARSVADVLSGHVSFEVECIDRMYCNLYVPALQHVNGVVWFWRGHRGAPFASSALMEPMTRSFAAAMHRFAAEQGVPWVEFVKGQRKDDVAADHLARFAGQEGVLFVGRAQEKTAVFRTEKRRNPVTGASYPWIVTSTAMVNHFYVYAVDADFGPFFVKFAGYFPYNGKLYLNGHEWAKRQAAAAGIGFSALDNGFASCDDPARLQAVCDRLGPEQIDSLARKWLARLPHPFTAADCAAGYRYDISILQAEFSLTQVLDRPVSGRIFFEEVIRENLDLGRPDRVGLVFGRSIYRGRRNRTPGMFATRVITDGVTPSLHVHYKHSKVKQYHKLGRALRTETTINNSYDFGIGRRLTNLPALRTVGFTANRRLLRVEQLSHDPAIGEHTFRAIHDPVTAGAQQISGLRFGDDRTHTLLTALLPFRMHTHGFRAADLRTHLAELTGQPPETISPGRLTYDLRRLRAHGLITRIPGTFRYQVTDTGLRAALFLTRLHTRLIRPGLAELHDPTNPPTPLRRQADRFTKTLDDYASRRKLTA